MRIVLGSLFASSIVLLVVACGPRAGGSAGQAAPAPSPTKLALVDALPKPSLPPWIDSISPSGQTQSLSQIRVIFKKPVTKLEALSGDGPQDVLSHVSIEPPLRGKFTVFTPRMIGFVPEQALPLGTRVKITLSSGLRDLDGDALDSDLAWTFETKPLEFTDLPTDTAGAGESSPPPVGLRPTMTVESNAQVDETSLQNHITLTGNGDTVPVTVKLDAQPTPPPGFDAAEIFDPSLNSWSYDIVPQSDLRTATEYTLNITPGVQPAFGNLASVSSFSGAVRTYDVLRIVPTPSASPDSSGRFQTGDPSIAFDNPLDPKSVAANVTISPAPSGVKDLAKLFDGDPQTIAINPYLLDPNRTYTVTLGAALKDTFGQTLGHDQTVTVATGNFTGGQWAPSNFSIIPAGLGVAVNYYATNLPDNRYQSAYATVDPKKLLKSLSATDVLPSRESWAWHKLAGARSNVQSVVRVPLEDVLHGRFGSVAYGFRSALDGSDTGSNNGIAQLTNIGLFAQFFPQRAIVLTQHLSDGGPAPGVHVTVYRNVDYNDTGDPQACASGTTDARGEVDFTGVDVERCYAGYDATRPPSLATTATEGGDVATLQTSSYSGIANFDVPSGWSGGAPLSRGTIFTDRQLYQPGETGQMTGIAYYVSGNAVVSDKNATYAVTLTDPNNKAVSLGNAKTDAYGVFSMPLTLSKQQGLGYYTIDAKGTNGNDISGSLRVAEFKPPNFKMTLSVSPDAVLAGASAQADAAAAYLFGAPLQGGTARAYVTRDVAALAPKGRDDYSFGRQWFWPERTPSFDTDVVQQDLPLDAQGKTSLAVPVPADLPFPMTYTVDMAATDVSHLSVSDSKTFLALPSDALIGLASEVIGAAGTPMTIRSIVTSADGTAISGRPVHYELQKMTYTSATENVEGGEDAQQAVKYDTVATADATSGSGEVTVQLTPPDAGAYRVKANVAGAKSDASETDLQVFAFGPGEADWGASNTNTIPVKLDKKSYAIGDTATALIASPFDRADVYVAVIRGDTIYRTTLRGVSGATRIPFKITDAMMPNAAIEAVVVRRGNAVASVKPGSLDALSRVGVAGFSVDVTGRYLKLAIAPQAATVTPGGSQRVAFTLTSKDGKPARGEIVAMVVNDAILQLSGYRPPDLVTTIFAQQPISTAFSDNRDDVVLKTQTAPLEKGYGYGGGYLAGAASTRVRQHFLPMAYYGTIKTGADGKGTISFSMPDDLTTWRVMAVALGDDDAHFAGNDATFISTQPLITNPLLPQFARTGDAFDAGVSVSNQTGSTDGAFHVLAELTGALTFANGTASQTGDGQATAGLAALRFPVVAGTPAPTTVSITTKLAGASDAFKVPFTVSNRATTDAVIDAGAVAASKTTTIPVDFSRGGWVELTMANSIVPQFAVPSNELMVEDALPLADDAASRLVVSSALAQLQKPYRLQLAFDPGSTAQTALQHLLALQRPDGDFNEYAGMKGTDPFVTAYALQALVFARQHGVPVDAGVTDRAATFLAGVLANPQPTCSTSTACKAELRFDILWALAQNGDRRSDFLSDIVKQSGDFCTASKIRLARYLLQTPGWQGQGAAMADKLFEQTYLTGRYSVENVTTLWGWRGTLVNAQSEMLQLMLERHAAAEQTDGAVRALVAQQCKCGWPTIDDSASALTALSAYAAQEHLTAAGATAQSGGATVANATFGSTAMSQTFTMPASSLKGGSVAIGATGGTVHYTVLYTYDVPPNAPGELAALRVIRTLRAPGANGTVLATMDLAPVDGAQVAAGNVFDVGVRVIADHPVDGVVIEDPLPAGFEAVDMTFNTTLGAIVPQTDSWEIGTQQIYSDRVVAYAPHLGPGVYDLHYLVRSVTPGTFKWPGARAYLVHAPEQFGRSASTTLRITP